jgi:UDP-4-amino-4,6-dideoxy-N-acetyl-beta-L-altrosamine N-acetyltransferase
MYEEFRKNYIAAPFVFKNYVDLTTGEAIEVLECRNNIEVRKWMTSTEEIPLENHLKFIENLKTSEKNFYWAVYLKDKFLGGFSIVGMDDYRASSGIFLNPKFIGTGIGIQIAIISEDFIFMHLGVRSLYGVVQKNNKNAIQLNKFLGYTFLDTDNDFIPIELTREMWISKRKKLLKIALGKHTEGLVFTPLP